MSSVVIIWMIATDPISEQMATDVYQKSKEKRGKWLAQESNDENQNTDLVKV